MSIPMYVHELLRASAQLAAPGDLDRVPQVQPSQSAVTNLAPFNLRSPLLSGCRISL